MAKKESPQNVIQSYQRKQQIMPFVIGSLAVLFVVIGIILLVVWFVGEDSPISSWFPTETPTSTLTFTATPETPTSTPTETPTETPSPTVTETPTPSGPFLYTVKEGDTCWDIAVNFKVELPVLLAINNFVGCPIKPGDTIRIPAPDTQLPTDTPIPTGLPRGTKLEYVVRSGDTIASIASKFNAKVDTILKDNKITDANKIEVGQKLIIRVNEVTPTNTLAPTSTAPVGENATPLPPPAGSVS
ncbi:MAG: LysM peptidoglycan-binding domain-containing protein [Anaerolineae bacterium]|nr:LysM peptidoglycan-binding domain-containing protein [Anaerolineae bacterium]